MFRFIVRHALVALALNLLALPAALVAQAPADIGEGGIQLSRAELEERLATYEQTAQSSAYSGELRALARQEASLVQSRLSHGDFQVGDQIALRVEGEEPLTGTFVVSSGRTLELPVVGGLPLEGVLRSELESHLTTQLARFIRDPRVQARALFRVTITGAVGSPGYYVVPAEALLTDALMLAGGPANQANLTAIRVERGGQPIWSGDALQRAITEGRTLDQLSLGAGDHIVVPQQSGGIGRNLLYGLSAVSSLVLVLSRLF